MLHKMMLGIVGLVAVLFSGQAFAFRDTGTIALSSEVPTPIAYVTRVVVSTTGSAAAAVGRPAPATPVAPQKSPATPTLNGIPIDRIVVLTEAARKNIFKIYAKGQALEHDPRAFSKVGDSTMLWPPFLDTFDDRASYRLGTYAALAPTVSFYSGSFSRTSIAVRKGMHTWTEFDPTWVDQQACRAGEGPLACELRLNNSSIALIRLGANDTFAPTRFQEQLRKIVDYCIANGVIPVLGTKPDRLEGSANTLNKSVQRLAQELSLPLWDYDRVAATVPGRGLGSDKVHFRGIGSHNYLSSKAFASADSLEDLTGLLMLDAIRRELASEP